IPKLVFTPETDANGTGYANFNFTVNDGTEDSETANTITIDVTPENDAPIITSDNTATVAENTSTVTTVTAEDADEDTINYSITGGADSDLFEIDENSGEITFKTSPDFELPTDEHQYNVYEVEVTASDSNDGNDIQTIAVTVTDENEGTPGITVSRANLSTSEDGTTASLKIVLNSQPNDDVVVTVASNDTTEGTVDVSSVTFTPANWNISQTLKVTGVDDTEVDGDVNFILETTATSGDSEYDGLAVADVSITNVDNDTEPEPAPEP
ncbi:cadherin repeat domain-containing protein, partial [Hydrocoleum sp. CS-953]|uniref:cadherin repeat domain-containing protein n=1 Tax=Hydrocoleum sp. CS-953 TaxID=1671698 RepID=UPI001AEFBCAB